METPADRETDIPEPVIAEPDDTQTYGNIAKDAVAASADAAYPEYPAGNLSDIEKEGFGAATPYPDGNAPSLSYREFMKLLGHYAHFGVYAYSNMEYAKYAEYATYLLLQSFAKEFGLPSLESACKNMLEQIPASTGIVEFTLDSTTLNGLRDDLEYYNSHIMENITAKKTGYSLTAYRSYSTYESYDDDWLPRFAQLKYNDSEDYPPRVFHFLSSACTCFSACEYMVRQSQRIRSRIQSKSRLAFTGRFSGLCGMYL